jgi:2-oxoglutarate ferredoxin oxidoreductase subunit delta
MVSFIEHRMELGKGVWVIFPSLCKGCGMCLEKCPKQCLSWSERLGVYGTPSVEVGDECTVCGLCALFCPDCAIRTVRNKDAAEA